MNKYIPQIAAPGCFGGIGRNCLTCMETIDQVTPDADLTVKPKITINRDDEMASGTQTAIIGQKMDLDAVVTGGTPSTKQWSIEGTTNQANINSKIIKDYNLVCNLNSNNECQNPTSGTVDYATPTNSNLDFYWLDSGSNREVKYTVTVNGVQNSATLNFDVKKPTVTVTRQLRGSANISVLDGLFGLHFGKEVPVPPIPGIVFNRTIDQMPSGFNGTFKWVQIWNKNRRIFGVSQNRSFASVGTGLDSGYPYSSDASPNDNPGIGLDEAVYNVAEVNDTNEMYLMFTPNNPKSKEIPLKKISWGWSAKAEFINGAWQIVGTPTKFANTPVETTSHPTWNKNALFIQFLAE